MYNLAIWITRLCPKNEQTQLYMWASYTYNYVAGNIELWNPTLVDLKEKEQEES